MENFLTFELGNEFSDVLIFLNESHEKQQQPMLAHMCILAARCAYFEAYFRSFMPKDRRILVVYILTNYKYGRKVSPPKLIVNILFYCTQS
jgi:hypothetical protein